MVVVSSLRHPFGFLILSKSMLADTPYVQCTRITLPTQVKADPYHSDRQEHILHPILTMVFF